MNLDVGCGGACKGDINVDLKRPCDVKATIYNLPFYTRAFSKASAYHVIEHLSKPAKALDELMRVANVVEITVPHAYSPYSRCDKSHKQFFKPAWFQRYAESRHLNFKGTVKFDVERLFIFPQLEIKMWFWRAPS